MSAEPDSPLLGARDRIGKRGERMSAVEKVERGVAGGLYADFETYPRFFRQIGDQVENFIAERVGTGADRQPDDALFGERFTLEAFELFDRRVCVRRRLKVGDICGGLEPRTHSCDSFADLHAYCRDIHAPRRAETAVIAEDTASVSNGAVDIRTGKAGVDADFTYGRPEHLAKIETERIVIKTLLTPVRLGIDAWHSFSWRERPNAIPSRIVHGEPNQGNPTKKGVSGNLPKTPQIPPRGIEPLLLD